MTDNQKIRVLIAHYMPNTLSGAERAVEDMLAEMDPRFEFTMLTPGEGSLARFYRERGLRVWSREIDTVRRRYPGLHTYQSFIFSHELRREKIDLVVSNTFAAASRVGDAARMAHLPHAVYVREFVRSKPLHTRILRRADRILAVSNAIGKHLEGMVPQDKVCLAYDLIRSEPIEKRLAVHRTVGKRRLPFDTCCPVVGWVGRLTPYKQPDLFVRAAQVVHQKLPDVRFVIAGGTSERDADYSAGLVSLTHRLGLQDVIHFLGDRQDIPELISELDLLCITSTHEPFPRVVLEAQVIGCPLVVPRTGGCPEMVIEGQTAMLFDSLAPDAPLELAGRILRLLSDPGLRQRLAENASLQVKQTFAGRAPAEELGRIFKEMVNAGSS